MKNSKKYHIYKIIKKKEIISLASLFIVLFIFFIPIFAGAQADDYKLLAPLTPEQSGVGVDLGSYLSTMFKIFVAVAGILATLMIVVSGFQYMMSETGGGKKNALDRFRNAIIGLLLALGSYIILNTINPDLVNLRLDLKPVQIEAPTGGGSSTSTPPTGEEAWGSDEDIRNKIKAEGISINKNNCTFIGQKGCTSLTGLPSSAINGVIKLHTDCKCSITITGGTEYWLHTTHKPGQPILDLWNTPSLNRYLTGKSSDPSDKTRIQKGGASFTFEAAGSNVNTTGTHWHVVF